MTAGWFRRERTRSTTPGADDADARIARQAQRAGRSVEEQHEEILRGVLPNIRRSVADAGLTMREYLQLNRVEYEDLLATNPGSRPLIGRRHALLDYDSFVRMRQWIEEAAGRAGEDPETWTLRVGMSEPRRAWQRRRATDPASDPGHPPAGPRASAGTAAGESRHDALLERLERLAALRDSGALTDEEFRAQKQRMLDDGA